MTSTLFPSEQEARSLIVGPESVAWRSVSDTRLYAILLYPLLLQVAHPTVGAGVRDFSDFDERPWNRLMRTIDYVNLLVYGGPEAIEVGRRLRGLHKGFRGTREDGERYYALEPGAYAWVHATLIHAYVAGNAHFTRPLKPGEREQFYREYRGLGRLLGVREVDLPPDWEGFRAYFDAVIEHDLVRTGSVDRVLESVRGPVPSPLPVPGALWRAIRIPARRALLLSGLGLLPASLRERFGVSWSLREEAEFRSLTAASRALSPLMPAKLRVTGPEQLRWRRRAIASGPLAP
ncbi:MAG TPA: oxygenase MpaB family protein [Solirubrobacteraceae bacterium]|jgi:uncharacterized protein (DUF2236 family)|nr:oxygenase MpaB family protein [Solirubrobacteraceae bacterium]